MQLKNLILFFIVLFNFLAAPCQERSAENEGGSVPEKKWTGSIDLLSRYIWRGQSYGGNYPTLQATVNFKPVDKLTVGAWASTNFRTDYFYPDGETYYRGYNEFDIFLAYQLTGFLSIQLANYYWPALEKVEGVDNNFFNYGPDGTQSVDLTWEFDFSEGYKYPVNATVSTLIAGNDYRFDEEGEHPKRNFTTYMELGYTFNTFSDIDVAPSIGAVLNNWAGYYAAADYGKASFINLAVAATRGFDLGKGLTLPLSLTFTHNAAGANTESFGRNFLVAGVGLYYE